ncbi:MAG TPA: hypothetical protein VMH90_01780 [Thermoplasmata archaeon]|nr:hypothetical protein [Thermoplasmata archaeon]
MLGALAILLLACAGPVGATRTPSGTTSAPYRGSAHYASYTLTPLLAGPCGFAVLSHPITWHGSTGKAGWAERVRASGGTNCTGTNGSAYAAFPTASATLTVAVPIGAPNATGYHDVAAAWSIRYTGRWDESHGGCPKVVLVNGTGYQDCSVAVGFTVRSVGFPRLIDLSTGNFVPSYSVFTLSNGTTWVRDVACAASNGSVSNCSTIFLPTPDPIATVTATFPHTFYWNGTYLNASHRYAVECSFAGSVFADTASYPRPWFANASASLNLEGYGDGLTLSGVTIS